ncbi:MAG: lamin tail domain-containing protein [Planctomycetota bacterium]
MSFRNFAICTLIMSALAQTGLRGQDVLINEVNTGNPDWVEIYNFSSQSVDVGGWRLESSFGFSVYPSFQIPAGTSIAAGQSVILLESQSNFASGTGPANFTTIFHTGFGWGWVGISTGSVVLFDDKNVERDMLIFGQDGLQLPAGASASNFSNPLDRSGNSISGNDVIARTTTLDTNTGLDWSLGSTPAATPGMLNPGQALGAIDVREFLFDGTPTVSLNPALGQFEISATISGFVTSTGISVLNPAADPIIGGTFLASGSYSPPGIDLANFAFSPATILVTAGQGTQDGVIIVNHWVPDNELGFEFGGPAGATPLSFRRLRSLGQNALIRTGSGSAVIQALMSELQSADFIFQIRDNAIAPLLLRAGTVLPPLVTGHRARIGSASPGQVEIGIVGAEGSRLYHLFVINPSYPLGSGPVAGITFGPLQFTMATSPLGTEPYHVQPDSVGRYYYTTPGSVVPSGWTLDFLAVQIKEGAILTLPPQRILIP